MAFPTVVSTNTSVQTPAGTSHTVSLPGSIVAGNLLLIFFATADIPTITTPANWNLLRNKQETAGATSQQSIFYKVATGSEGATVTITTGTSFRSAHATYQISGYSGNPEASAGASGISGNPDPDSLTPSGGAKDYLWIASGTCRSQTFSSAPTSYTNLLTAATSSQVAVGTARRELNATSTDPGNFTITASNEWTGVTVAISPTASATKLLTLLGVGV